MAYGLYYKFKWESDHGTTFEIDILKDGYSGAATQRPLGSAPVLRRERNGNICGTSLEFDAECHVDGEFATLYTSSATEYRVDLYSGNTLIWRGYITPELYSEPVIAPPYDVHVIATDSLGELKMTDFSAVGRKTIDAMLEYLLSPTGLSFSRSYVSTLAVNAPSTIVASSVPGSVTVDLDHLAGKNYYEVLDALLGTFHACISQQNGRWLITRETDVDAKISGGVVKSTDNNNFPITIFGGINDVSAWPVGQLSQSVSPAKNGMTISADNKWKENLLEGWGTTKSGATWRGGTSKVVPYAYYDAATGRVVRGYKTIPAAEYGYYELSRSSHVTFSTGTLGWVPTQDLRLSLKLASIRKGFDACTYAIAVEVYAKDSGNNDVTLHLMPNGTFTTTPYSLSYPSKEGTVTTQDFYSPEEVTLDIPVYSRMSDAGIVSVVSIDVLIDGGEANSGNTLYSTLLVCGCTVLLTNMSSGYIVRTVLNNGARGEGEDVDLVISDHPDKDIEEAMIENAALSSGAAIETWKTGAISAMSFLEMITRDYCLSIATPRLIVEGTLNVQANPTTIPYVFLSRQDAIGVAIYFLPTSWDWDLYNDELKVSMLSLPAAAIQVTSETRVQGSSGAAGLASGSSTGSISPATGGGASKLAQLSDVSLDDLAAGQMLKYNVTSEVWENTDSLFELVAVSGGYAVHVKDTLSDGSSIKGIYSDGYVSAGGLSTGGGTGSVALTDNGDNTYALTVGSVTASALATKAYVDNAGGGGGGGTITVDTALSSTSTNPVQNKVIYAAIGDIETLLAAL